MEIKETTFKVIVKTNAGESKLVCYDAGKQAYKIELNAKPIEGEANKELIKFLSRLLKKQVRIVSGLRNRQKKIVLL
ncbi:DUF167 domain-containing protein [Candidatus Woesearchaeota archaeon]|nr:DUF167 domain-containing protein [Candidatus Woesearchaeota archaeon]